MTAGPSEAPSAAKVIHPPNLAPLVSASRVGDAWLTRDVTRDVTGRSLSEPLSGTLADPLRVTHAIVT